MYPDSARRGSGDVGDVERYRRRARTLVAMLVGTPGWIWATVSWMVWEVREEDGGGKRKRTFRM